MEAKEEIQSEISGEVTLTPPITHIPFAGLACVFTLILPWPYPTVTALPSTCLPVPSLKDRQGREKEGGREKEQERRGDFCSQENKTVKSVCVCVGETQKVGEEAEIYRPVSCFPRWEI